VAIPLTAMTGQTGMRVRQRTVNMTGTDACTQFGSGETEDYVVDIAAATVCSGTPTAGTASGPGGACAGTAFSLTLTGYTLGSGITIQWESSPAGAGTWSAIAGATNASYSVANQTTATDYHAVVTCTNSSASDISNTVSVSQNSPTQCYCTPGATNPSAGDQVLNVTFAGINNTTGVGNATGYNDYTSSVSPATVSIGGSYPISMTINYGGTEYGGVWIDWNQNGVFDASEFTDMGSGSTTPSILLSQTITVPATAIPGTTRMRVRSKYAAALAATDPCAAYTYGETEDYAVTVTTAPANNNAPGAFVVSVGAPCSGNSMTNSGATQATGEPVASCSGTAGYNSVWYKFTAPASGGVKITTDFAGSSLTDTRVALFSVTDPNDYNTFSILYCDDNNGNISGRSTLYASGLTSGTVYYVLVDGISAAGSGNFCLEVTEIDNTMLSPAGSCAGGKTNTVDPSYTAWSSLVDNNGLLIANVKPITGTAGTYGVSVTENTGGVRQASPGGQYYLDRNFLITGPSSGSFNLQLFFSPADLAALQAMDPNATLANLNVTHQQGSTCQQNYAAANGANTALLQTSSGTTNGPDWIKVTTPGFSNFYIMAGTNPLSIALTSISAVNAGNRNRVDWTTGAEVSGDKFDVERSIDGINFTKLGTVDARGAASSYSFWDNTPVTGVNHYRLRMTEPSGKSAYSQTVDATVKTGAFQVIAFPNPVTEELTVQIYGTAAGNARVSISDVTGKTIRVIALTGNTLKINMNGIAQGFYLVKYSDDSHSQTIQVNKQ
jgi:hypothetical protein